MPTLVAQTLLIWRVPVRAARAKTLAEHQVKRPAQQQQRWMTNDAIQESLPACLRVILTHSEGRNVAVTASLEVTRRRVVQRVIASPDRTE